MFPVLHAKAGKGFVERIEADSRTWTEPTRRFLLSIKWEESPFLVEYTAIITLKNPRPDIIDHLNRTRSIPHDPMFLFDARTAEERAAAAEVRPGNRFEWEAETQALI